MGQKKENLNWSVPPPHPPTHLLIRVDTQNDHIKLDYIAIKKNFFLSHLEKSKSERNILTEFNHKVCGGLMLTHTHTHR